MANLNESASDKNVMEPRRYQMELLSYVMQRNAIIYLPTGAGKTYIAIMALKRFSHEMQETIENGGKRAIFMCNTVELARQQAIELKRCTNLRIGFYVGERNVDYWSARKWNDEIKINQVLVGTAQIFVDIVSQNYLKISDLSVVIIDECHHARNNHPMHEFMRHYRKVDEKSKLPRVIGLTGVLLKGNKLNKIREELESLEAIFHGNIVTVNSIEEYHNVMTYSTKPTEKLVRYARQTHKFKLFEIITATIAECCGVVKQWDLGAIKEKQSKNLEAMRQPNKKVFINNLLTDFLYQMDEFGLYAAAIAIMSPVIEFELKKRAAETMALRNLYRYAISVCEKIRHMILNEIKEETTDPDDACHTIDIIFNYSTPKMRSLLLLTKELFANKNPADISCLIFVERRYTAKCVYYVLQQFVNLEPVLAKSLRPQFMVGRNSVIQSIESLLYQKWNKTAIESFRSGECNLLVCSNVLEEGIDVQACNYVFSYDPLKTFNSYVQSKGRARSSDAIYAIFAQQSDEASVIQKIKGYQEAHRIIQQFLIGRILDRDEPKEEAIAEQFEDLIPPFKSRTGAVLLASNALQLLYRYCMLLPTDAFGVATPWFTKNPIAVNKFRVELQMPLQSSLKETIISDEFPTTKQAKISAAFKACKILYEQGELNERLLPVTRTECVAKVSEELFNHWKKFNDDISAKTAGKQQRRLYNHKYPDELHNAVPQINELCYAYEIRACPQFETDSYTEHIATLLNTNCNYAILTRKGMPALAEMPLFMNQGKLSVQIVSQPIMLSITSEQQLKQLSKFHLTIFRDILECWKNFLVLDQRNQENSYLIVPLNNGKIDWELVQNFQRLLPQRRYSVSERQKKVYKPEDYIGKVVNKWYSGRDNQRFVVTKVLTHLTPQSPFDNNQYSSYIDFIDSKYKNEVYCVVQKNQFMLEVRALTSRRNFYVNAIGKSAKSHHNSSIIRLIPELCHNFMFPGDMWLKALLLPSILHRVHFMLHAENLRLRVNTFLGIACNEAYQPKKLIIDESLSRAIDIDGNAMEEPQLPKKVLPALPTLANETVFRETNLNDVMWKDYLEPEDISRKEQSIFPVELDYYYKFVNGSILNNLTLSDEEWSESQLDMPKPHVIEPTGSTMNIDRLELCDVSSTEKRHLNILELTLNGQILQSAEQADFLAAITTAGANDVFDMERFEFLGDSFLKFSVSLYLVHKYPKWHEGFLTEIKGKMVSNRNLIYCLLDTDIPERISGYLFKPPHEWLPPLVSLPRNLLELICNNDKILQTLTPSDLYTIELDDDEVMSGACTSEHLSQVASSGQRHSIDVGPAADERRFDNELNLFIYKEALRDKVVADTLEAILGVCVKNYGIYNTFRMLEFFGICKPEPGKSFSNLMDLNFTSALLQTNISSKEVDSFLINHEQLEKNLGYHFRDRAFLLQALTHPSYPTNRITGCYQELEFIGDAILDFLISCYIYERCQHMTPGKLTDLRSALVNNVTLGGVCVRHRFHLFLLAENSALAEKIKEFTKYQEKHNYIVTDEVQILMEETTVPENEANGSTFNMAANVEVPKALGDILEALIAAVYLDSRDLRTTWHVIYGLLEEEINQFTQNIPLDAVRQLIEHKHANPKFGDPVYDESVYMVKCQFTCLDRTMEVNGFGANGKMAKKAAAKHALQILSKRST